MRKLNTPYAVYSLDHTPILCREEPGHGGGVNPVRHRLYRVTTHYLFATAETDVEVVYVLAESPDGAMSQAADDKNRTREVKSQTNEVVPLLLRGWGSSQF